MNSEPQTFIKKRFEREVFTGLPLTIFAVIFFILLLTFLGITESIVNSLAMVKFDESFSRYLFTIRTPFLAQVFYFVTNIAAQITIVILAVATLLYLYFKKELSYIYAIILTCVGTEASVYLIKILINRPRPLADIAYYIEKDPSFPSGHSAIAIAFYGFCTYYLLHHISKGSARSVVLSLGSLLILLIGFSRLYLGVHYMSDVLGGFLIGGLWLTAGMMLREYHFYTASLKKGVS